MYCHGMGQHRKDKEYNNTDLVSLALPPEFCNVIKNKQQVKLIDPTKPEREITFVNVEVVY